MRNHFRSSKIREGRGQSGTSNYEVLGKAVLMVRTNTYVRSFRMLSGTCTRLFGISNPCVVVIKLKFKHPACVEDDILAECNHSVGARL